MAYHDDLLEQARHLATRERYRPRQASLRRAVSTAYYSLFHFLISETVRNWKRPGERNTLARMFEHGTMKKACRIKLDHLNLYLQTNPSLSPQLTVAKHLHLIAKTFVQMQQDRHMADYDGSITLSRTEVIRRINSVGEAFTSWKAIRNHSTAQDFLVTLLLKERL